MPGVRPGLPRWLWLTAIAVLAGCVNLTPPKVGMSDGMGGSSGRGGSGGSGGGGSGGRTDAGDSGTAGTGGDAPDGGGGLDALDAADADVPTGEEPLANGRACMHGGQCYSSFCVDGVCCNAECTGACVSCKVTGSEGACMSVPAGEDPRDQCAESAPATCGLDGTCDGAGACRRYVAGSECAPGSCTGATETAASTCDGNGTCKAGGTRSCAPQTCQNGSCGTACTSDAQCLTGFFCEATSCRPKRALAAACDKASDCMSNNCAQGVCCNSACSQNCYACNLAGSVGTCTAAATGTDPLNQCATTAATTCGTDGQCDGAGACRLFASGTACGPGGSCTGNVETGARTCNGLGTCLVASSRACSPYVCGATSCLNSCTTAANCQAGNSCTGSACVPMVPVDAGTMPGDLVIDDFADSNLRSNKLGGVVTWDNQTVTLVSGEQRFVWNGQSVFQDFIETFRNNWCEFDARAYSKIRFRMRSSAANKRVDIYMGIGNGSCGQASNNRITSVTVGTTMSDFEVSLTGLNKANLLTVEFTPSSTDGTVYHLDDVVFAR